MSAFGIAGAALAPKLPPFGLIARYDVTPTSGVAHGAREYVARALDLCNPDGTFDFSQIIKEVAVAKQKGVPLILGVVNSNPWDPKTPKCVPDGLPGDWIDFDSRKVFVPDENDSKYRAWFDRLMLALGRMFGKSVVIEMRYGCGGEGTNGGYHSKAASVISAETAVWMVDCYIRHFHDAQKISMTDNREGLAHAVEKIPGVWLMRCSLGNKRFDDLADVRDIIGVPGKMKLIAEPYGGPGVDPDMALRQIKESGVSWVSDWNWGEEIDLYNPERRTLFVLDAAQRLYRPSASSTGLL